jgi:hypothetical protein
MREKVNTSLDEKEEIPDTIDRIRTVRNDLIKSLLVDENLLKYLLENHRLSDVSKVRQEFMKRSLQTLLISPVDLAHYGQLILEIRKDNETVPENSIPLFYQDIDKAIKSFVY